MAVVLAAAFWSRSNNLRIASLVVLTDWLLTNFWVINYGRVAINYIAAMNAVFFCFLFYLYSNKKFKGRTFYRPLLFFYFLYLVINFWHMGGLMYFPETFSATYYFVAFFSNVVFILISITLVTLSLVKGVGNRTEGGLMVVFEDWASRISNFSAEYRLMMNQNDREKLDQFELISYCFKEHILKKSKLQEPEDSTKKVE